MTLESLMRGQDAVVVGSAPLAQPLVLPPAHALECIYLGVNGGIGSVPRQARTWWVLNARSATDPVVDGHKRHLHRLMLRQGAGRDVQVAILAVKDPTAEAHALAQLARQQTVCAFTYAVPNETRRAIEAKVGARTPAMTKQALSLGLFAVCLCLDAGARTVTLEGFSWRGGYAYTTETVPRGHEAGDKLALALLLARYPNRVHTTLAVPRSSMATKPKAHPAVHDDQPPPQQTAPRGRRVKATKLLVYDLRRRRPGDVFLLRTPGDFKKSCMVHVDDTVPLHTQTPAEASRATNADILAGKNPLARRRLQPNAADELPDPEDPGEGGDADLDVIG